MARRFLWACTNEYVAGWALQSMGDELATQTRREAARQGKAPGRFVAEIVRDFERTSDFAASAEPISRYWLRSASYLLTVWLAEHEAEAMIGA